MIDSDFILGYAKCSYERIILSQSHIRFNGLWKLDYKFYIHCQSLDQACTDSGIPLGEWFHTNIRIIGCPISLVSTLPEGAQRIPARTPEQLSVLQGYPLNADEFHGALRSYLGKSFPHYITREEPGYIELVFSSQLTDDESLLAELALAQLGVENSVKISIDESLPKPPINHGVLTSKNRGLSNFLLPFIEEDDDLWMTSRVDIFATDKSNPDEYLPEQFKSGSGACFINTTIGHPKNIRCYLTLYNRVIFALPNINNYLDFLASLQTSLDDLIELVAKKRVYFIAPNEYKFYSQTFMERILEANPEAIIFTRRLSLATIADSRKRTPILYPPFGNEERRQILDSLRAIESEKFGDLAQCFRQHLGQTWAELEYSFDKQAAFASIHHGIGRIANSLLLQKTGSDHFIETSHAAISVEWAAALGATYFPVEIADYSEFHHASLCASILSGVNNNYDLMPASHLSVFLNDILMIDNDAPVLEVADVFTGFDLTDARSLYSKTNGIVDLNDFIKSLNTKVRHYEKSVQKTRSADVLGIIGSVIAPTASIIGPNLIGPTAAGAAALIPIGAWLVNHLLQNIDAGNVKMGGILTWLRAKHHQTTPDAVLVSRLRGRIDT